MQHSMTLMVRLADCLAADDYMRERESGSETGEQTRDDGEAVYGANEGW